MSGSVSCSESCSLGGVLPSKFLASGPDISMRC